MGLEDAEEGGIGGGLEDDALSRLGKGLLSLSHGVDHAEGVDNPARLDLPAVAAAHPSRHSGAIRLIHGGVAVDAELAASRRAEMISGAVIRSMSAMEKGMTSGSATPARSSGCHLEAPMPLRGRRVVKSYIGGPAPFSISGQ